MKKQKNKTIAIIPARAGSKRIPRKNTRLFAGKPLLAYSITAAHAAGVFDEIIVSTESEEVAEIARTCDAKVPFLRPPALADDFTPIGEVVKHTIVQLENRGETVAWSCCIFATAPMVAAEDIQRGLTLLTNRPAFRTALAVTQFPFPIQRALSLSDDGSLQMIQPQHQLTRSQDLPECYHDAGQFFWTRHTEEANNTVTGTIPVFIDRHRVQDIDTPEDWKMAELMYQALRLSEKEAVA